MNSHAYGLLMFVGGTTVPTYVTCLMLWYTQATNNECTGKIEPMNERELYHE